MLNNEIIENNNTDVTNATVNTTQADPTMEGPEKTVVSYRFGPKNINLDNYIYNLEYNVQRYLNAQNWSPQKKKEFQQQYLVYLEAFKQQLTNKNNRIYTDSFGNIHDPDQTLIGVDTDGLYYNDKGQQIDAHTYSALKPKKQKQYKAFNASSEVAKYFNWVGIDMPSVEKQSVDKKERPKFNNDTMGYTAWWQYRNDAAGDGIDFGPYINKDPYDKIKKTRPTTNRIKDFYNDLNTFIVEELPKYKDYDWSETPFKSYEEYRRRFIHLRDNLGNEWDGTDVINANAAGIHDRYYQAYFTTEENPHLSPEEKQAKALEEAAEAEKLKNEEDANFERNIVNEQLKEFTRLCPKYGKSIYTDPSDGTNYTLNGET